MEGGGVGWDGRGVAFAVVEEEDAGAVSLFAEGVDLVDAPKQGLLRWGIGVPDAVIPHAQPELALAQR